VCHITQNPRLHAGSRNIKSTVQNFCSGVLLPTETINLHVCEHNRRLLETVTASAEVVTSALHCSVYISGRPLFCSRCALNQRSPTGGPRETFGGPWRNLDIICSFYVYYSVLLYSLYSLYINITLIILL
jgi:hypothetical protein